MSDLVEIVARANYEKVMRDSTAESWEDAHGVTRAAFRQAVVDFIIAIEKAGYRIVPVEPTPEMENAADACLSYCEECKNGTSHPVVIWPAMLAAAPKVS